MLFLALGSLRTKERCLTSKLHIQLAIFLTNKQNKVSPFMIDLEVREDVVWA